MKERSFFREYWADVRDIPRTSNWTEKRWRANDESARLASWQKVRWEGNINNLMLLRIPDAPQEFAAAEVYAEVWGGHAGDANRSLTFNGKGLYVFPDVGGVYNACVYHYTTLPVHPFHLVQGVNSLVMQLDRGTSFLGNYMIDNLCVRGYVADGHPAVREAGLAGFRASVITDATRCELKDRTMVSLRTDRAFAAKIERVEFYARHEDFDENGNQLGYDWRFTTVGRDPRDHVGTAEAAPFSVSWDTTTIPSQDRCIELCALVRFHGGLCWWSPIASRQFLRRGRRTVRLYPASTLPDCYWSRDNQAKTSTTELDFDPAEVDRAWLCTRIWDGGEGTQRNYFTLNGRQFDIATGKAPHVPVIRRLEVPAEVLKRGTNTFVLNSQTEHHGIEMLVPYPVLKVRFRDRRRRE
jgi:hypothetical protein